MKPSHVFILGDFIFFVYLCVWWCILLSVQVNLLFPRLIFPFGIICAWEIEVHALVLCISWWSTTDKPNLSPIFFYSSNIDHDAIKIIKRRKHIFGFQGAKINKLDDLQHAIIFILMWRRIKDICIKLLYSN